nr:hypothetical protein [Segnochrobactrum spirostomi]
MRAALGNGGAQPVDADGDLAGLLVVPPVGLAVGPEAAALVEVEEGATDLVRGEGAVQGFRPQAVRVEFFERLSVGGIRREKARLAERADQGPAAAQKAIAPSPHGARGAPRDGEGRVRLRLPPIGKDARAEAEDLVGLAVPAEPQHAPADRVGSDIEGETTGFAVKS